MVHTKHLESGDDSGQFQGTGVLRAPAGSGHSSSWCDVTGHSSDPTQAQRRLTACSGFQWLCCLHHNKERFLAAGRL